MCNIRALRELRIRYRTPARHSKEGGRVRGADHMYKRLAANMMLYGLRIGMERIEDRVVIGCLR